MRLMKKYLFGANAYHVPKRSFSDIIATPQSYCCPRATDIFEASAEAFYLELLILKTFQKLSQIILRLNFDFPILLSVKVIGISFILNPCR